MGYKMIKQGYIPDPPAKDDKNFTLELRPKIAILSPGDVDLRWACTDTNQYSMAACVGNASADSIEVVNAIEGRPPVELSRMFLYTLCRNKMDYDRDGHGDINQDDGTFIRLAFQVLSEFGICSEATWAYTKENLYKLPSIKAMREAAGYKIHGAYRIYETGYDRVEACIAALRSHHPVVFATKVGSHFKSCRDMTPLMPLDTNGGGHAMLMVGYIDGKGFIIKNSWGTGFGSRGYCVMDPSYIAWASTHDLWVPTRGFGF